MAAPSSGHLYVVAVRSLEYLLTWGPRQRTARFWIELSSEPARVVVDDMSERAHSILKLATQPPDQREAGWLELVRERSAQATHALVRDAFRRGRVISADYQTMQLTPDGHARLAAGEKLIAARHEDS